MSFAEVPDSIQALLEDYIASIQRELPDFLAAFYLQGSIALGAYNPHLSDIDFIAVINHPCSAQDINCLSRIHADLKKRYATARLSGSYLQVSDVGKLEDSIAPHPHYHDANLHLSGYHDINLITWWILKHHGVTLYGTPAQELDIQINWDEIEAYTLQNMNSYWVQFIRNPRRIIWLYTDYGVQWAVLGVLRQYVTLRQGRIVSKTSAGVIGLQELPSGWQRIIQEAMNLREQSEKSLYRFRLHRMMDAFLLIRMVIYYGNNPEQLPR